MSRTLRAIGPTCQKRRGTRGQSPVIGMRPCVALRATMPVCAAGPRTEMARSLPRPSGDMPAGRALEIPGVVRPSGKEVVGFGRVREFRKVRLRKQDRTGALQARDAGGIRLGDAALGDRRAVL